MVSVRREIEHQLLRGDPVSWNDPQSRKPLTIRLVEAKQRALLKFVIESKKEDRDDSNDAFITGLGGAYRSDVDPASSVAHDAAYDQPHRTWRLHTIETFGFGGLNLFAGKPFVLNLDGKSMCLEGPNGSGKSSLAAAVAWALTGESLRDGQPPDTDATRSHDVLDVSGRKLGVWPPIAAYPEQVDDLKLPPDVRVTLTFVDDLGGDRATMERRLTKDGCAAVFDPRIVIPSQLIETNVLMPVRMARMRFGERGGKFFDAIQALTGLDELVELSIVVDKLCHGTGRFLRYARHHRADAEITRYSDAVRRANEKIVSAGGIPISVPDLPDPDILERLGRSADDLSKQAVEHIQSLESDLSPGFDISTTSKHKVLVDAVALAKDKVSKHPLVSVPTLALLSRITEIQKRRGLDGIAGALVGAREQLRLALQWDERQRNDKKLRLKALASRTLRAAHQSDDIVACPLCEQSIQAEPFHDLKRDLEVLRESSTDAERTLTDVCNEITATIDQLIPAEIRSEAECHHRPRRVPHPAGSPGTGSHRSGGAVGLGRTGRRHEIHRRRCLGGRERPDRRPESAASEWGPRLAVNASGGRSKVPYTELLELAGPSGSPIVPLTR